MVMSDPNKVDLLIADPCTYNTLRIHNITKYYDYEFIQDITCPREICIHYMDRDKESRCSQNDDLSNITSNSSKFSKEPKSLSEIEEAIRTLNSVCNTNKNWYLKKPLRMYSSIKQIMKMDSFDILGRDLRKLVTNKNSETYNYWIESPLPAYAYFSFYNITNVDEIYQGKKPRLQEVGPIVYRKDKIKENVVFHSNGTVSYNVRIRYHLMEKMSKLNEDEEIIIIDLLSAVLLSKAHYDESLQFKISRIFAWPFYSKFFVKFSVKEYLWGYEHKVIERVNYWFSTKYPTKYGIYYKKNDTLSPRFEEWTGYTGNTGKLVSYNNKSTLPYWNNESSNMINGTVGVNWNPDIKANDTLYIFSPELGRSLPMIVYKNSSIHEIPTYRFTVDDYAFELPDVVPSNEGFCLPNCLITKNKKYTNLIECCLGRGALNLISFNMLEIIITGTHFYGAEGFLKHLDGIKKPNKDDDMTWIEVEPITGKAFCGRKKLQTNFFIRSTEMLTDVGNDDKKMLSNYPFPLFHVEEVVPGLGGTQLEVKDTTVTESKREWKLLWIKLSKITPMNIAETAKYLTSTN
ncbi:hypothetical protein A3Q56_01460 [Intoshia linei]|uniref:Uncharacterized protein n=1 Tax=Intoshia linei TaxID=1819745 RepID=A0A177B924_9BILA|nr:hypothetical protein A3Q56_01460 [Intoshia linei]